MAKRIAFRITDIDALQAAYPEVVTEETVPATTVKIPNKELIYKIVKLNSGLNRPTPGVKIVDEEKETEASSEGEKPPEFLTRNHQQGE